MSQVASQSQILVVDDSKLIRRAASKILNKDYDVVEAEDGQEAWDELQNNHAISVVFTDLVMPNMDGYELLEKIRHADDPAISNLPVIIITGVEEAEGAKEDVLELGATDFISKPFDSISLKTRASAHINYRNQVQSLEKRVATDKVTGLYTDVVFRQQGEQALAYALRHGTEFTLVRFDIDRFAELFVKHGKEIAEQILAKVASFIREDMRTEDIAARLGVCRFALLLPSADQAGAEQVVNRIRQRVANLKLKLGQDLFHINFSTGTTSPSIEEDIDFTGMMQQAEQALQQATEVGGGELVHFQTGEVKPVSTQTQMTEVEVNIEELLQRLDDEAEAVDAQQLASAMRKFLPLMAMADEKLKLGLSKVVSHLINRLKS